MASSTGSNGEIRDHRFSAGLVNRAGTAWCEIAMASEDRKLERFCSLAGRARSANRCGSGYQRGIEVIAAEMAPAAAQRSQ